MLDIKENKIIELLIARDERGLSTLYDNYAHSLFGIIVRIVRDNGLAEEILQQTFLKAWEKITSFDNQKSALFTWLSVIARNTAIDKRRLKSFDNNQKTDDITDFDIESSDESNASKMDAQSLLTKLDDKYKIVLDKIYLQGYSQSDVARELDMPLGTVKTRVRHAIRILRQELKSEEKLFIGFLLISLVLMLCL